jgi:hypothetical protein
MPLSDTEKAQLLGLFCKHTVEQIHANKRNELIRIMNVTNRDELIANQDYNQYYNWLVDLARDVEEINVQAPVNYQAKQALLLLMEKNTDGDPEKFDAAKQMIQEKIASQWKAQDDIDIYLKGVELLQEWIHFFISYTNQDVPSINNTYKGMIAVDFPGKQIRKEKDSVNLIAKLVYSYLKMQRVTTFYDKEDIGWGDEFKEKIFKYTNRSYALIQIVERKIFVDDPDKNYCFREYEAYKASIDNFARSYKIGNVKPHMLFLISNPDFSKDFVIGPSGITPTKMQVWVKEIKDKQFAVLHTKLPNEELKITIQKAVAKFMTFRDEFFKNYLDSVCPN